LWPGSEGDHRQPGQFSRGMKNAIW
jgi:hypothetical protein